MKVTVDSKKGLKTNLKVFVDKKTIDEKISLRLNELSKTVNITDRKNKKHVLEGEKGQTLMQLIDKHELANPYGICGGEPMCGTCHVYVEKEWLDKLNPKTSEEELAIDNASELKENSRCGCQIDLTEELNGLTVTIGPNENQI